MITPTTGEVYRFKFLTGYDIHNGTYRLVKLMTYNEYLLEGGGLIGDFFQPANKTEEDLAIYLTDIRLSKMMKLVSPDDLNQNVIKFAPISMLETIPDYTVSEYHNIGIIANIGIVKEKDTLTYVLTNFKEQFQAALGIVTDPKFLTTSKEWLTDDEYMDELAKRDETMRKTINYFSENTKLVERISSLQTQLKEYEALIIHQNKKIAELEGNP